VNRGAGLLELRKEHERGRKNRRLSSLQRAPDHGQRTTSFALRGRGASGRGAFSSILRATLKVSPRGALRVISFAMKKSRDRTAERGERSQGKVPDRSFLTGVKILTAWALRGGE